MENTSHIVQFSLIDATTWQPVSDDPDRSRGCWVETMIEDLADGTPTLIS